MARTRGQNPKGQSQQYAALPWRRTEADEIEVLLVTSRISGKWLIPKGWLIPGLSGEDSACREAYEEAGVEGDLGGELGRYSYTKITKSGGCLPCSVAVFGLRVHHLLEDWPEAGQRVRQWVKASQALEMVAEPGLRAFLQDLEPERLDKAS